ncbi:helix-turn-helix transcriptional regulator [Streptomyces thermolilacinus]|uniref:Helix-turn-helix transcriptional regulator n=1 Tax=Streptomyces thermolilacinus SPC6 TaxID=1306406 RepID=A0A1D3DZS7_9ACTN|nr:LuxR C-terminal-related transcriptional regulator [Streptomyces thermolilacinus]OEJ97826.1 helix-turn-helix transcriptional regulator [Streptomyces thermolilacinus SPC6]
MRRATGLPVAFGGLLDDRPRAPLRIEELSGASSDVLRGLAISPGSGLGGRSMALARPCAVTDYPEARHISHEYDGPVAVEGLRSVLAVPVVVRRRVRAVLYGALRTPQPLGDRVLDAAVAAARDMEQTLVAREEARRLLDRAPGRGVVSGAGGAPGAGASGAGAWGGGALGAGAWGSGAWGAVAPGADSGSVSGADSGSVSASAAWEAVREAHGELRALAPRIADPALRAELLAACGRLASAAGASAGGGPRVGLAPRELDVLAAVATGATNADAARRLGLRPETVKGYLRSAMRKLGAHTRLEAVVAARRAGLLP